MAAVQRFAVDMRGYPELVVVYLGMKIISWRGLGGFFRTGRGITQAVASRPDGLLAHEFLLFGPLHIGMRQYWRDLDALEAFTRAQPHKGWWASFAADPAGTAVWHEAYRMSGGMEGIYLNMQGKPGLASFAPKLDPVGPQQSSRARLG